MRLMSRRPSSSFEDVTHAATVVNKCSKRGRNGNTLKEKVWKSRVHHDGGEVLALEAVDGQLQRLVERRRNPLSDEPVQVD